MIQIVWVKIFNSDKERREVLPKKYNIFNWETLCSKTEFAWFKDESVVVVYHSGFEYDGHS